MNGTTTNRRTRAMAPGAALLPLALALALAVALALPAAAIAQDVLDRTPNMAGAWVGIPWTVHSELPHRFHDAQAGEGVTIASTTTFVHSLGLPGRLLVGLPWAMQSPTVPGTSDEVQPFVRYRAMGEDAGFAAIGVTAAWNGAAGSIDGEVELARWLGPLRLLAAGRAFSDARDTGEAAFALAAGAVWHPLPGRAGLALAADIALPFDAPGDPDPAWSAGIQAGVPHTGLTLSLHATNTAARTLQGATFAVGGPRYAAELAFTIPAGYLLGRYPDREAAMGAVAEAPGAPADVVVDIRRYAFGPTRLVVERGAVVEWVNRDAVVHTATAEDGAWDSGGIRPGESWRARFDEPGVYPYYCGPHPYMKGVVIVR